MEFTKGVVSVAFDRVSGGVGEGDDVPVGVGKGVDFIQTDNSTDKVVDVTQAPNVVGNGLVFHNLLYALPVAIVVKTTRFGGRSFENTVVETVAGVSDPHASSGANVRQATKRKWGR